MGGGYSNGFALLVVLFILLIIVGANLHLLSETDRFF
nr:YjcZ family sporulation protein [Bacillus velezensis]